MNQLFRKTVVFAEPDVLRGAHHIARLAVRSLYQELALYPKPGLVSFLDNGAHRDMNAATFMRSLFSLRGYFVATAAAGMRDAEFNELQQLGLAAESRMLLATRGINTHRGAIFTLGMLAAAAGCATARKLDLSDGNLRATAPKAKATKVGPTTVSINACASAPMAPSLDTKRATLFLRTLTSTLCGRN